jgi:4-hydroxythreonine-4-phosphate dehydrogenase
VDQHDRLAITMGDPAGVGPEIILKLFKDTPPANCVVYGDPDWLAQSARMLGYELVIESLASPNAPLTPQTLPVYQACDAVPSDLSLGHVSAIAGKVAYQCVQRAIDDALDGKVRGMVTAPLNKQAIHSAGFDFPGHTEILSHRCGDIPVAMMLANDVIRVVLVTIHIPLSQVAQTISIELEVQAMRLAFQACVELGIPNPRVAVAGLNPHAGESGKFGHEEQKIIEPAIKLARELGIDASGPWPGDTIFGRARQGEFDVVVAQYHDQGLIPVKYLGLDQGVNVTIGLPFVRTSVDHGTAFDIAGQGIASAASLKQAVDMARTLIANQPQAGQ